MAAAKRRSSPRMRNATSSVGFPAPVFPRSNGKNVARDLGKAPRFNFPDEFQRCLGKAAAGSTEPKDGSETVAIPQHDCLWAMGGRVAQELLQLFALSDEAME